MKKRLFVAINLPPEIKGQIHREIESIKSYWPAKYPIRFTAIENLHITLIFLGNQEEKFLEPIKKAIEEVAPSFFQPEIQLNRLIYGPEGKFKRMIWLNGESNSLALIRKELEKNLISNQIDFKKENRDFSLHVTLARFNFNPEPSVPLPQKIDFSFKPKTIDLMESRVKSDGPIYSIVKTLNFKEG